MKLLHLTSHYPPFASGSAERQCAQLVRELAARNHVYRVLTSDVTQPNVPDHDPHVNRRLRLYASGASRSFLRLLAIQRQNLRTLAAELEAFMPELVVVWGVSGFSHSLLWQLDARGVPMLYAILDPWPRHRVRDDPWYRWWAGPLPVDQRILRRALRELGLDRTILRTHPARRPNDLPMRHAFFASRALRDSIELAGYDVSAANVLPYGLARDEIPASPQRRDELRRILWIGSLDSDHDPLTAVQALQELRHQGEMRFSLDIFGRGDVAMEARVRDYVRNAQLGGAVTIRHTAVDERAMVYPNYDIFLHTARHPGPFPLAIIRAMAARVPVIAAPEGSVLDVIHNTVNGLTFRTGDPFDCAARILTIVERRGFVEEMTDRAYREVLDNYSATAVGGRLDRLVHAAGRSEPGDA